MSYLDQVIIDTHFIQRGRFGRLAEAVARFPNQLGIGLAEDTGLIIKKAMTAKSLARVWWFYLILEI